MNTALLGEFAALFTAFCWTVTSMSFEEAGKSVGSLSVNIIRLWMAIFLYFIFLWIYRGNPIHYNAETHQWLCSYYQDLQVLLLVICFCLKHLY